jgi:hypothetical protein
MQNKQIRIATDQCIRITLQDQRQELIVLAVAARRVDTGFVSFGYIEKRGIASDECGKFLSNGNGLVPIKLGPHQHLVQLSQTRGWNAYLSHRQRVDQ